MDIEAKMFGSDHGCDGLVFPFFMSKDRKKGFLPNWASSLVADGEFSALAGQALLLRFASKSPAFRVVLLGLGEKEKAQPHSIAGFYASAFNMLKGAQCSKIGFVIPSSLFEGFQLQALCKLICSQAVMADYSFSKYKQEPEESKDKKKNVQKLVFLIDSKSPAAANALQGISSSIKKGMLMGLAANYARSLQNEPANVANPSWMAAQAIAMAKKHGLKAKVFGRSYLKSQGMNAMLAVAGEAAAPPKLVALEYRGAAKRKGWDIALVGKGVTFDSGGISIKPAQKMDEMKFDKSGACTVFGALMGCSLLRLPLNVVGVAALVENMPDAKAYRPGDIIRACNGKTIEVLNTDAEGRLILADALAWAAKHYSPSQMVDFATLTGACIVALGDLASGILSRNDLLASSLIEAGERSGERLWRLPLWPEYDEKIKSEIADIKNIGEPGQAGTIAGASFLQNFAGDVAWAHIDIAGTADGAKPKGGLAAGGYGVGVRLILEYLSELSAKSKHQKP